MTTSILDEVVGMGPKRKKALLKAFGSFTALRNATLEDIKQSGVVPSQVAEDVYAVLRQYNGRTNKNQENRDITTNTSES